MADFQAAKRYAQAVFSIARRDGTMSQWRSDLDDIAAVLAESDAAGLFGDGRLPVERRQALADRALDVGPLARNLAHLLIAKDRTPEARAVADAFGQMADAVEGIVYADVTTAVPLADAEVTALSERLGRQLNATVHVRPNVDASLVGGLVVRIGDRIVDGSIRTRLRELRRELVGAR